MEQNFKRSRKLRKRIIKERQNPLESESEEDATSGSIYKPESEASMNESSSR